MTMFAHTRVHQLSDYILHRQPATAEPHRILDLGCGDGSRAIGLAARRFNQVIGVDSSESLITVARNRARNRKLNIDFRRADPFATGLEAQSCDEVLLLGRLFGHGKSPRADVELLLEAQRLLRPGGMLRLRFADGAWLREYCPGETVESLPTGFIHRRRSITDNGHCLRIEIISADEACGARHSETIMEWLYTPREVSDLLYRLGFRAMTYDHPRAGALRDLVPSHTVRCIVPPRRLQPVSLTG